MTERKSIEEYLADFMEGTSKQTRVLLEVIGSQQLAITRLADLLTSAQGVDQEKLARTIKEFEDFEPDLSGTE